MTFLTLSALFWGYMSPELHATSLNLRCVLTSLLTLISGLPARVKFLCTFHLSPFFLRTHYEITLCGGTPHFDNDILTLSLLFWGYQSSGHFPTNRTSTHKQMQYQRLVWKVAQQQSRTSPSTGSTPGKGCAPKRASRAGGWRGVEGGSHATHRLPRPLLGGWVANRP